MKTNSIMIGVGAVALLGAGVFLGGALKSDGDADIPPSTGSNGVAPGTQNPGKSSLTSRDPVATKSSNSRESSWAKLSEKYGDSRTKLSKKVTEDISKMMGDAMDLVDMGSKLAGGESAAGMASQQAVGALSRELDLTDEQKEKAREIVTKRVSERLDAVRELSSAMNDDPSAMMEAILAGDAFSRGEITEDEYQGITADTTAMLGNIAGFGMGGMGGRGGVSQFSDPLLTAELMPILDPAQQQKIAELSAKAQASSGQGNTGGMPFQNGTLPVMDLERLDASVQSTKKLTSGLRAMMEGFGELQNAQPPAGE
ncbi:hypothetical protein HZ994_09135 [Akkermansiaceae bacterium]|nr:hypothetical protein HZ994_09135 [Akkermansiaceae bacterium]